MDKFNTMKTYTIYFEIFGKKMKTVLNAKNKIKFIKIEPENNIDFLKNIFGI